MDKEVFIQKLDDTFTVLQQLEVCIKEIKNVLDNMLYRHRVELHFGDDNTGITRLYINMILKDNTKLELTGDDSVLYKIITGNATLCYDGYLIYYSTDIYINNGDRGLQVNFKDGDGNVTTYPFEQGVLYSYDIL